MRRLTKAKQVRVTRKVKRARRERKRVDSSAVEVRNLRRIRKTINLKKMGKARKTMRKRKRSQQ